MCVSAASVKVCAKYCVCVCMWMWMAWKLFIEDWHPRITQINGKNTGINIVPVENGIQCEFGCVCVYVYVMDHHYHHSDNKQTNKTADTLVSRVSWNVIIAHYQQNAENKYFNKMEHTHCKVCVWNSGGKKIIYHKLQQEQQQQHEPTSNIRFCGFIRKIATGRYSSHLFIGDFCLSLRPRVWLHYCSAAQKLERSASFILRNIQMVNMQLVYH